MSDRVTNIQAKVGVDLGDSSVKVNRFADGWRDMGENASKAGTAGAQSFKKIDSAAPKEANKSLNKLNSNLRETPALANRAATSLKSIGATAPGIAATSRAVGSLVAGLRSVPGFALFAGLIGGASKFVETILDAEDAQSQLQASLESTKAAARGLTEEGIDALTRSLAANTTASRTIIKEGASILATFTNIGGEVFPQAAEAALNMSAKFGVDVKGAMVQLGKALNDPIAGVSALKEIGVAFTEEQKAQIKTLVEANDVLGAQTLILNQLEVEIGGAARALKGSGLGSFWDDIKDQAEAAALGFAEGVTPAIDDLAKAFSGSTGETEDLFRTIGSGVGLIVTLAQGAFTSASAGWGLLADGAVGFFLLLKRESAEFLSNLASQFEVVPGLSELAAGFTQTFDLMAQKANEKIREVDGRLSERQAAWNKATKSLKDSFDQRIDELVNGVDSASSSASSSVAAAESSITKSMDRMASAAAVVPEAHSEAAAGVMKTWEEDYDPTLLRLAFPGLKPEDKAKLQADFQEAVETIRGGGVQMSAEMKAIGEAIGVNVALWTPPVVESGLVFDEVSRTMNSVRAAGENAAAGLRNAGEGGQAAAEGGGAAAENLANANAELSDMGEKGKEAAAGVAAPKDALDQVAAASNQAAEEGEAHAAATKAQADQLTALTEAFKPENVAAFLTNIQNLSGVDLSTVVTQLAGVANGVDGISSNVISLQGHVESLGGTVASVAEDVAALDEATAGLEEAA